MAPEEIEARALWPSPAKFHQWYQRLLNHPGSVVILALEAPEEPDGPQWKGAWLSAEERSAMRRALEKINAAREKKGSLPTTEIPTYENSERSTDD